MYPYDIFPGFDLYALMYLFALVSAILILRILSDKLKVEAELYNFVLITGVTSIVAGYVCSILTQSVYDWIKTGSFRFGTGMTFYGGLFGGIAVFLLIYFTLGRKKFGEGKLWLRRVPTFENIAACCVTFAHATGRIGCLFAGCCHGAKTDAWYGIWNENLDCKTVPTQLFESVFLYLMFVLLLYLTLKGKYGCHIIYMIGYGVWRFAIEYLRTDDRGASFIPGLTPSQVSAIFFVAAGVILYMVEKNIRRGHGAEAEMSARDPSRRAARTRERAGGVIAAVGVVLLAVLLLTGKAGLGFEGTADPDAYLRLTVTRACGSLAFLGVIMYLGYRPTRCTSGASLKETAAAVLPALAVAVNNAPLIPLLTGGARITADAGDVALYAVESLFIGTFEELAFRGVLLLTVVERFGKTRRGLFLSAVTTSAVFGASHLFNLFGGAGVGATLLQVSYSFLIGAMCSLVLLLTGSLASCILIHAVYDFGGYLIPRLGEGVVWTVPEIALTAAVGVAAAAFYINACRYLSPESVRLLTNPHAAENVTEKQKM